MKIKIVVLFLLVIVPAYFFACPAKKVDLTYNKDTKMLSIIIDHPVTSTKGHYIDDIKILVDGKEVKRIKPTKQFSLAQDKQELEIGILEDGAKIEVKTHCNQSGNKSGKLTVKNLK